MPSSTDKRNDCIFHLESRYSITTIDSYESYMHELLEVIINCRSCIMSTVQKLRITKENETDHYVENGKMIS